MKNGLSKKIFAMIVIAFLIYIRFYRAVDFFSFNFDEEYQAHLAYEQVKNFHPIWIGVSASNLGFYLGPGFTYLNAFLFKLTNGDPISLAIFAPLWGIITAFSLYFVAREIFGKKPAFWAIIFYLGSSLLNFFDRRFWNPLPIPFITIWLFYSLIKAEKDSRYFILTSFLLATSAHIHLSLFVFWPLALFFVIKNIKKISLKTWALIIGVYILIISPLIVFDFNHNFDDLLMPLRFIQNHNIENRNVTIQSIDSHWGVWLSSLGRLWFIKPVTDIQNEQCLGQNCLITPGNKYLIYLSLVIIFYFLYNCIKDIKKRHLLLMMIFSMIFFVFYPGYSAEYYLLNFFILFCIVVGLFLADIPQIVTIIGIIVFIAANSVTIFKSPQYQYGLTFRRRLIKRVMVVVGNTPYSLETYGKDPRKYHPYGGWRYLFKIYGKKPAQSFADEFFGWIYQNEITSEKPQMKVAISEGIPYKSKEKPLAIVKEGNYYGYVFSLNSNDELQTTTE